MGEIKLSLLPGILMLMLITVHGQRINVAEVEGTRCRTSLDAEDELHPCDGAIDGYVTLSNAYRWDFFMADPVGEWIEIIFPDTYLIDEMQLSDGFWGDEKNLKDLQLTFSEGETQTVESINREQGIAIEVFPLTPVVTSSVRITILSTYGERYNTIIEVRFMGELSEMPTTTTTTMRPTERTTTTEREQCEGDLRFNDCGSPCERTCWDQTPMCIERCDPKCECPREAPIRVYPDDPVTGPRCRPRRACDCPGDQIYMQCATCRTPCPQSGSDTPVCPAVCQPGCACPSSAIFDLGDNRCGSQDECPILCDRLDLNFESQRDYDLELIRPDNLDLDLSLALDQSEGELDFRMPWGNFVAEMAIRVGEGNGVGAVTVRGLCLETSFVPRVEAVFYDGDGNELNSMEKRSDYCFAFDDNAIRGVKEVRVLVYRWWFFPRISVSKMTMHACAEWLEL